MWYVAVSLIAMLYFVNVFGMKPPFVFFLGGILAVILAKYP